MPQRLAGQLLDGGDPVADEPVFVVDTAPADESNWSIVATDRSAADGSWSVTVPNADAERYHAVAQFEESGTFKNALSKPFLTSQPFAQAGAVSVGFDVVSPTVSVGSAIPDSGDLQAHYDWTEASGTSTVSDQSGNGYDLSGTYTGPTETINGLQAGEFDGLDGSLDAAWSTLAQPFHLFWVSQIDTLGGSYWAGETSSPIVSAYVNQGDRTAFTDQSYTDGAADTSPHVHSFLFNGASSDWRVDGSSVLSTDIGTNGLPGLRVAANETNSNFQDINFGEFAVYATDKSNNVSEIEQYLADKWGITL